MIGSYSMHGPLMLALISGVCFSAAAAGDPSNVSTLPDECTQKLEYMPDLCQTDKAFGSLPYGGRSFCAPTALANALIAMDQQGYDNLVAGDPRSKEGQRALLEQLGTRPYLETNQRGIGPISAMKGIQRFVRDRGYQATIEWRGWRRAGEFVTGKLIDADWLREGVVGPSNVLLNVGWYRYDKDKDLYSRIGGHYMTLAGYRQDGDRLLYLIQDPASRSGPGKITHVARLVRIQTGHLAPWQSYGQQTAVGHFLVEGVVVKSTADVAILDGAIRLVISKLE
jgi:hypothetical protein